MSNITSKETQFWRSGQLRSWGPDGIGFICDDAEGAWRSFATQPDAPLQNGPCEFWVSPSGLAVVAVRQAQKTVICDGTVKIAPIRDAAALGAILQEADFHLPADAHTGPLLVRPAAVIAMIALGVCAFVAGWAWIGGAL